MVRLYGVARVVQITRLGLLGDCNHSNQEQHILFEDTLHGDVNNLQYVSQQLRLRTISIGRMSTASS